MIFQSWHLYIGCKVKVSLFGYMATLEAADNAGWIRISGKPTDNTESTTFLPSHTWGIKPILRSLEDMTETEGREAIKLDEWADPDNLTIFTSGINFTIGKSEFSVFWTKTRPAVFAYLLSRHFDLFGLIESGQAIDAKSMDVFPYPELEGGQL